MMKTWFWLCKRNALAHRVVIVSYAWRRSRSLAKFASFIFAASFGFADHAFAACTTTAGVMTCTVGTTNDTVDATGLPANAASLRDAIIQVNSVAPPPAGQTHVINLPASFVGTSFKVTLFKFARELCRHIIQSHAV
jgi:hypothetical protein